jgi:hypothetical protein
MVGQNFSFKKLYGPIDPSGKIKLLRIAKARFKGVLYGFSLRYYSVYLKSY